MNQFVRPIAKSALVPDPNARKDVPDNDLEEAEPVTGENAAGFLKNVIDSPAEE
ncbi:MAG: hypothetical protein JWQ73_1018 [Variovorax sp.]|nr:hypothetical protein [Variovorax sp.]